MPALELLTGFVIAPGTTLTGLTMAAGNSLTVRNAAEGADVFLLNAWADEQTALIYRIRSPFLHDNVQGIRMRPIASEVDPLLPLSTMQILRAQDTLIAELSGSAAAGDIETACLLLYYSDLPGVEGIFIDEDALRTRMRNILTVENTLTLGTAGGYSGEEAINAEFDLLRANTDYAILGYTVNIECACVRWRGSDWGNLGVGGPGNDLDKDLTRGWFINLSEATGLPLIPVFNSADRANVLVDGAQDENGTDVVLTTILAELET